MGRLRRFEDHRYVGVRDTMRFYDSDDPARADELEEEARRVEGANLIQTFGPDTEVEARNRGFRPA